MSLKEKWFMSHSIDCILSIFFSSCNKRSSNTWIESEFIKARRFEFLWLDDVVAPVNLWVCTLGSFKSIRAMVHRLKITLSTIVGPCIRWNFVPLCNRVRSTDLENVNGDRRFIVPGDFFASVDSCLDICVVSCHSIHQKVSIKACRWESARHRSWSHHSFVELIKWNIFVCECNLVACISIYSWCWNFFLVPFVPF